MKSIKKTLLAGAVASIIALPLSASAGVIAQSVLELSNLQLKGEDGNALSRNDFALLVFNDNTDATATLNGSTDTDTANSSTFGTLDLLQQSVGVNPFGENDYTHHGTPPTTTVARGDTLLANSPLADTGLPVGAEAHTVAEVQIADGAFDGSSRSNLGLITTFQFKLLTAQKVTLDFNANEYLIAALTTDARIPGSVAQASAEWVINVKDTDNIEIFRWTPDGTSGGITGGTENSDPCSLQNSVAANLPGQTAISTCSDSFSATSNTLSSNTIYTLNIRHGSRADATNVPIPEPSTLTLAGLSLLGMGVVRRRRKQG